MKFTTTVKPDGSVVIVQEESTAVGAPSSPSQLTSAPTQIALTASTILSPVAISGSYLDLTNRPASIPGTGVAVPGVRPPITAVPPVAAGQPIHLAMSATGDSVFDVTLTASAPIVIDWAPAGVVQTATVIIRQGAPGGFTPTPPANVTPPMVNTFVGHADVWQLTTDDGGATVFGQFFNVPTVSGQTAASILVAIDTTFDGLSRNARDLLNNWGICVDFTAQTPAQAAAMLEHLKIGLVRSNLVANNTTHLDKVQATRQAQAALGSVRPVTVYSLIMSYMNDPTTWAAQKPLHVSLIEAGVVWGLAGPNEINNYIGAGHHGVDANPPVDLHGQSTFAQNLHDWAAAAYQFLKVDNLALAQQHKVILGGPNVAPVYGPVQDYPRNDLSLLVDYSDIHFYAPYGYQPGYPFGYNPGNLANGQSGIGYFGNVPGYAHFAYGPRQFILSESGATTTGTPNKAKDGVSQAKYIMNQAFAAWSLNAKAVFTYCLADFDTASTTDTEGNYGVFLDDKVTPKPAANAIPRVQDILSLNLNANDPANQNDAAPFKPGINAQAIAVVGLTNIPTSGTGVLAAHKKDGSTILAVWNEAEIDFTSVDNGNRLGGASVVPPADTVTVYLPAPRPIRVFDPMASTAISGAAYSAPTDTINLYIAGYPLFVDIGPDSSYTTANGVATPAATGFPTFVLGQSNVGYAHNYGGAKADDQFVTVGPPSGHLWTLGNFVAVIAISGDNESHSPSVAGSVAHYGPLRQPDTGCPQIDVFIVPVINPHATYTASGVGSFGEAHVYEIPPFLDHGISSVRGTVVGNAFQQGMSITANLAAIPAGAIGLFVTALNKVDSAGVGVETQASSDTGVQIVQQLAPASDGSVTYNIGYSGTIAAGHAAGLVTWPVNGINNDSAVKPHTATIWFSNVAQTQAPAAPTLAVAQGRQPGQLLFTVTPNLSAGTSIQSYDLLIGSTAGSETLSANVTTESITFVGTVGQTYFAKVAARNSVGASARSNEVSAAAPVGTHFLDTGPNGGDSAGFAQTTVAPPAIQTLRDVRIKIGALGSGVIFMEQNGTNNQNSWYATPTSMTNYFTNTGGTGGSSEVTGITVPSSGWYRYTETPSGIFTFYAGTDGTNWTQLGTSSSNGAQLVQTTTPLQIGGHADPHTEFDRFVFIQDGATLLDIDFTTLSTGQTSINAATGGAITLQAGASIT